MRGLNVVVLSGNVGKMQFEKTRTTGENAGNFLLAIEKGRDVVTWVRVNLFGPVAAEASGKLSVGDRVEVQGELMNRFSRGAGERVTEVRCVDIKFLGRFRSSELGSREEGFHGSAATGVPSE